MSWEQVKGFIDEGGVAKSAEVEQWMQRIASNPGKAGESYLMQAMNDIDLGVSCLTKATLLLAQTPFITFGVGAETVPTPDSLGEPDRDRSWSRDTIALLEDLSARHLTGHAARDAIVAEMAKLNPASRSLLYRVLVKEMRIGCGPKTVNKFHKGLVPIFEHKGAQRTKEALHKVDWSNGCWAEYKLDGWRGVVKTDGRSFETYSRNGLPMPNLDYRAADLMVLTRALIEEGILAKGWWAWDGEGKKAGHFNGTSSEARKAGKGEDLYYHIFDLLPWDQMAGGTEPIEVRYARLDRVQFYLASVNEHHPSYCPMLGTVQRFEIDTEADAWELYGMARELGHEGLILKQKGSFYTPGKTVEWVKVKPEETVDLVIVDTYPGKPGSKIEGQLGGIVVDHKGVRVGVGNLSAEDRLRDPSYFIGKVAEILYHEETPDGSLREPRLKCLRPDKYPEDADK